MGKPRKFRKTYSGPDHPWQKERIEEEIELSKEFGFKNKQEIYKMVSKLSTIKRQAKLLSASRSEQAKLETKQLFSRLQRLGLLGEEASYDAVLELTLKDVVGRRLQSVLVQKGLARTTNQARQFIVHQHVKVGEKIITSPSYLVSVAEEPKITFTTRSALSDDNHPERFKQEAEKVKEELEKTKKTEDRIKEKKEEKPKVEVRKEKKTEEKKEEPKEAKE
tara:strand:+ start:590 stop:1252 length:663 start_codon:yes stop_codon:yes gene_type:complete